MMTTPKKDSPLLYVGLLLAVVIGTLAGEHTWLNLVNEHYDEVLASAGWFHSAWIYAWCGLIALLAFAGATSFVAVAVVMGDS